MPEGHGIAYGAIGAGVLLGYAGITGKDIPKAVQAVISGKSPATAPVKYPIAGNGAGGSSGSPGGRYGGTTSSAVANALLDYQGHCYTYGGAPGRDGSGCWDCSSAVNYALAVKLGLAIPGYPPGGYDGTGHGPSSWAYLTWGGATTIARASVRAGDLCIFTAIPGHMGIAISNSQMVSALSPADGTAVTPIDGTAGGALICRRLKAAAPPGG